MATILNSTAFECLKIPRPAWHSTGSWRWPREEEKKMRLRQSSPWFLLPTRLSVSQGLLEDPEVSLPQWPNTELLRFEEDSNSLGLQFQGQNKWLRPQADWDPSVPLSKKDHTGSQGQTGWPLFLCVSQPPRHSASLIHLLNKSVLRACSLKATDLRYGGHRGGKKKKNYKSPSLMEIIFQLSKKKIEKRKNNEHNIQGVTSWKELWD